MANVKLKGLKISRAKGRYYVYRRSDGVKILNAFDGNKEALLERLGEADMLGLYVAGIRKYRKRTYPDKSLGALVEWFTDTEQCPDFAALGEETQLGYKKVLAFLEPAYDDALDDIESADVYDALDRAKLEKWDVFADRLLSALSTMFKLGVKRRWMKSNPALGVESGYTPNPNSNREWRPDEWQAVITRAPQYLKTAYMIARFAGYRAQSIMSVQWSSYQDDDRFGKCLRFDHRKNDEMHWLPCAPELQSYFGELPKDAPFIAMHKSGKPWSSAKQLSTRSSKFIATLERAGLVGKGLTLHGLRVTFAAEIKRVTGANDDQVAAALGDRDPRMGAHYTRHVEQENKIIFLYATMQ